MLKTAITFNTSAAEVWKGITDPEMVKQYFFGARLQSDWERVVR